MQEQPGATPVPFDEAARIAALHTRKQGDPGTQESERLRQRALEREGHAVNVMVHAMIDPGIGIPLIRMSFAANRAARASTDPRASRTRATLRELQFFERAVITPGTLPPARRYLTAGESLVSEGYADEGAVLQAFGLQLLHVPGRDHDPSLTQSCRARWRERHLMTEMFPYPHPDERAELEERILARLLRHPGEDKLCDLITNDTFTSHLRAEAWHAADGDPARVRDRFAAAMLRAPGWAMTETGWPGHAVANRYLDRLLSLPSSAPDARAAAEAVAQLQEHAERDCGIVIGPIADLRLLARRPQRAAEAGLSLKDPPPRKYDLHVSMSVDDPDLAVKLGRVLPRDYPLFGDPPALRAGHRPAEPPEPPAEPAPPSLPREVPPQRPAPGQPAMTPLPPPLPEAPGPTMTR